MVRSSLSSRFIPSPNFNDRKGGMLPDMILLHYTGMDNPFSAVTRLCDAECQVSAHYIVFEDGAIFQLVEEEKRAWHAGQGVWDGSGDINSCSIGIEISNRGHNYPDRDKTPPPFPDTQINAVVSLIKDIASRWDIKPKRILGHSDIAPERKADPGEKFPWERLFLNGIGLWVAPTPILDGSILQLNDVSSEVAALQEKYRTIGYGISVTGKFDSLTKAVTAAFQRRFRPHRVDGKADVSTLMTLDCVLENFYQA